MAARKLQKEDRNPSWKTPPPDIRLPPAQSEAAAAESTMGQRAESAGTAEDTQNSVRDRRDPGDAKTWHAIDAAASIPDQDTSTAREEDSDFDQQSFITGGLS